MGWSGGYGEAGVNTLFMLIQHNSNVDEQKAYLPLIRKAVKDGKENPNDLALLEDRIAMFSHKKQIYGTQLKIDSKNNYEVWPIKNSKNVNKRRLKIGLDTIETYLSRFGIGWDVEKHIEKTKKIF